MGIDVAAVAVLTRNDRFLRATGRRHHATVLVSAIIRVYWVHVDSQRVHEGLLTAARSYEALWHRKFVDCLDSFRGQLENGAVCVINVRRFYHVNTAAIYIDNIDVAHPNGLRYRSCLGQQTHSVEYGICYSCYVAITSGCTFSWVQQSHRTFRVGYGVQKAQASSG